LASSPGPQKIRLTFDHPQSIHRIRLEFREPTHERSQEFALYVTTSDHAHKEILRQQYTFSHNGSTQEVEDFTVALSDVTIIELQIDPGRHDKQQFASLHSISIA
jgi:hypothetical protein